MDNLKTPMKAIRAKCLDCSCNQIVEVRECPIKACPLWPYRMGMHPDTAEKRAQKRAAKNEKENRTAKGTEFENDELQCDSFANQGTPDGKFKRRKA